MVFATLSPAQTEVVVAVWVFFLGSAVGSFLNVVVYRLPAGLSLVRPGSHCPACKHPIRWYDNIPVLSWFVLRGRCRDCGRRISFRYPLVEAASGLVFVAVVVGEGFRGAAAWSADGQAFAWPRAALAVYHLVLLCTLFSAALIQYDGHRPPRSLFTPALIVGLVAPLALPGLRPMPSVLPLAGSLGAAIDGAAGLGAGLLTGWLLRLVAGPDQGEAVLSLACAGAYLGWEAVVILGPAAAVAHCGVRLLLRDRPFSRLCPVTGWLAGLVLLWIFAAGPIGEWLGW